VQKKGDKLLVSGVSHDNGAIREVTVNGQKAALTVIQDGVVDWSIELAQPKDGRITASGVDAAAIRETLAHVVMVDR
jgi:hypothetical protein